MKKQVREHHTYDLTYGTIDVTIEVKHNNSFVDKEIRLELKPDKINPVFEGWIEGQLVRIPVSRERIGEFELSPMVSPFTKDRIQDGMDDFLDAMYR